MLLDEMTARFGWLSIWFQSIKKRNPCSYPSKEVREAICLKERLFWNVEAVTIVFKLCFFEVKFVLKLIFQF